MKRIFLIVFAVLLCFLMAGCTSATSVDASYPSFTKQDLYRERPLILEGTVLEKGDSAYTNPDHKRKDKWGYQVENKLVTNYTVRIDEIFKGEYEGQTITIKVSSYEESPFALEVGKTYIFPLGKPIDAESEELEQFWGYYQGSRTLFYPQSDGTYRNITGEIICLSTIKQEIDAAMATSDTVQ